MIKFGKLAFGEFRSFISFFFVDGGSLALSLWGQSLNEPQQQLSRAAPMFDVSVSVLA